MSAKSTLAATARLKASYRRNLALGFGISACMILLATGIILQVAPVSVGAEFNVSETPTHPRTEILPPPPIQRPPQMEGDQTTQAPEPPEVGELVAVPDSEAPEEVALLTQNELGAMAPEIPIDGGGSYPVYNVEKIIDNLLPDRGEFVPYDEPPVPVNSIQPVYPQLERRAGIEGDVWLKVLIDVGGQVRDVVIAEDSSESESFGRASMEAALKTIWKPAISNGQPVAVWITYKVSFRLK